MIQKLLLSLFVATAALAQQEMPGPVYVWINGVRYETGLLERAQTWTALNQFTVNRPAGHTMFMRNTAADGLSGSAFFDDGGTGRGGVGWRNASEAIGPNSVTLHTFGAHPVQFATNNIVRAFVDDTGFRPAGSGYHLGSAADPWNTVYQRYNFNWGTYIAPELSSSFAGNWRLYVVSPPFPAFVINDNSATETFRINSSPREVVLNGTLKPNGTQNIGTVGGPWENAYIKNLTISGTCTGCGGGAPFTDATAILRDDADATKLLRFELGGFSTATTRILTPQNASYTLAGTNITQTFSANQTFGGHLFPSGAVDVGQTGGAGPFNAGYFKYLYSYELRVAPDPGSGGTFSGAWKFSSAAGLNPFIILDDNAGNTVFQIATSPRVFTFRGNLVPNAAGTYTIGTSSDRWPKAWLTDLDASGNSTITVGTGNFYLRHFSGADASCAGVADAWMGIRTDTNELQVCIGSAMKKVSLL